MTFHQSGWLNAESERLIAENGRLYAWSKTFGSIAANLLQTAVGPGAFSALAKIPGVGKLATLVGNKIRLPAAITEPCATLACWIVTAGKIALPVVGLGLDAAAIAIGVSKAYQLALDHKDAQAAEELSKVGFSVVNLGQGIKSMMHMVKVLREQGPKGLWELLRSCFAGETEILTNNGYRRIDSLQVGDLLLSRDEHAVDSELQYKVVEAVFSRIGRIWEIQINGKIIRTTSEHPFYVVGRCQLDSWGNDASKQYLNDPNESSLSNDSLESNHFSQSTQVNPRKYSHQNQENFSRRESPDSWQNRQNNSSVARSSDQTSEVATIQSAKTYNEFEEPFEGGWIETAALRPGDQFIGFDNQLVTVEAIRDTQTYERVYNVSVSDWHTYFIGKEDWGWNVWGHNTDAKNTYGGGGAPQSPNPFPGGHTSGTQKPLTKGAAPNSIYTHIDPKTGRAIQNAIYDAKGNVIGHVDFKNHGPGALSGHGHHFPQAGNPASGHGAGKLHIPNNQLPPGWDQLPPSIQPQNPIGS